MKCDQRVSANQTLTLHSPLHDIQPARVDDIDIVWLRRAKAVIDENGIPCSSPWAYLNESMAKHLCESEGVPYKPSSAGILKVGDYTIMVHELLP